MRLKPKTVTIGTKTLALVVSYSNLYDNLRDNQDGAMLIHAPRRGRQFTAEEARSLSSEWKESEIEEAMRYAAKELIENGIIPSRVRAFVDDRYGTLSEGQIKAFTNYCAQEAALNQGR